MIFDILHRFNSMRHHMTVLADIYSRVLHFLIAVDDKHVAEMLFILINFFLFHALLNIVHDITH